MRPIKDLLLLSCLVGLSALPLTQATEAKVIAAGEAKTHVGETATVCGRVVDARISKYRVGGRGRPTFLDLDKLEPDPVFLIVVWGSDPANPGEVETAYKEKQVCVTGKIIKPRGIPQIIVSKPSQIKLQADEKK